MKRKFLSLFAALALAVTASAQLRFGEEYVEADFNDPLTTVDKAYASWGFNDKGTDPRVTLSGANWNKKYVAIALEGGCPGSIDFDYACWNSAAFGNLFFRIEQSADGKNWNTVKEYDEPSDHSNWLSIKGLELPKTARYVRLLYSATLTGAYRKIKVNALHPSTTISLDVDKDGIDFGVTDSASTKLDTTITASWSDLGNIHAFFEEGENPDSVFSVDPAVISDDFSTGSGDFIVSVNPQGKTPGIYTANLRVEGTYSDNEDWRERIVPLKVVVRGEQTITWYGSTEDSTEVHVCINPAPAIDSATVSTGNNLTYATSDRDVIRINGYGRPAVNNTVGDAYVTARQAGDEVYKPAQLTRHFFVHDTTEFDTIVTSICDKEPLVIGSYSWNIENDSIFDTDTTTFYGSKMRLHIDVTVQKVVKDSVLTTTICGNEAPFNWRGQDFYTSGTYNDTDYYATGCDSILYTLNLTVQEVVKDSVLTTTICEAEAPFNWRGQDFYTSGTYNDTDYYATGCDSVLYTLNLTVQEVVKDSVLTTTICEAEAPFNWRGQDFYTTGTYNDTDYYATGCDSILYTLYLTVNPTYDVTDDDITVCEGNSFIWNDVIIPAVALEDASDYTYDGSTLAGCDSTVHVTLHVNPIQKSTETRTMTYGDAFVWNGVNYANKDVNTYKDTIVLESTVTGCDSLVILNLTINKAPQDIFWNLNDSNDLFIGDSLTVEPVASSGLKVTLSVSEGTAIKVNGKDVIAVAAGEATLQATVEANDNYEDAEPIKATFTVTDVTALKLLFGNIKDAVKKVLYEGHIYIMTNGKIFNAEGVQIQ